MRRRQPQYAGSKTSGQQSVNISRSLSLRRIRSTVWLAHVFVISIYVLLDNPLGHARPRILVMHVENERCNRSRGHVIYDDVRLGSETLEQICKSLFEKSVTVCQDEPA